ncbi:MAG: inorganic diphosphatase [Myxococcaceae bacterium]
MDLDKLPARTKDGDFHVVVESPRGSRVKLKYEPKLKAFTVARPLSFGHTYPFDWGFIPSTKAEDGDPLDVMILWDVPSYPGVVIPCRPLGVIRLEQNDGEGGRERNDRLIAIPVKAPRDQDMETFRDLSARERDELTHFFVSAVFFANKDPKLLGWGTPKEAEQLIDKAMKRVKRKR